MKATTTAYITVEMACLVKSLKPDPTMVLSQSSQVNQTENRIPRLVSAVECYNLTGEYCGRALELMLMVLVGSDGTSN